MKTDEYMNRSLLPCPTHAGDNGCIFAHGITPRKEDYIKFFKNHCVMCRKYIRTTWYSYQRRGNYCVGCNEKCTEKGGMYLRKQFEEAIRVIHS